jgi:peptidoglycan hydrolase CwlO-like protein
MVTIEMAVLYFIELAIIFVLLGIAIKLLIELNTKEQILKDYEKEKTELKDNLSKLRRQTREIEVSQCNEIKEYQNKIFDMENNIRFLYNNLSAQKKKLINRSPED